MMPNVFFPRVLLVALFLTTTSTIVNVDAFRGPDYPASVKISPTTARIPSLTITSPLGPPTVDVGNADNNDDTITDALTMVDARTLTQVGQAVARSKDEVFFAQSRKRWGIDHAESGEYWYDSRIHTFGNIGFLGALHAAMAPLSTKLIDIVAYDGEDVRARVAQDLSERLSRNTKNAGAKVLDMCCGVGISTRALRDAFPNAEKVVGLDTSKEMISMANFLSKHLGLVKPIVSLFQNGASKMGCSGTSRPIYARGNAENTGFDAESFDLVTVMYAFHEAPKAGRERILREAYRLLQPGGTLAVVDICTDYTPSDTMLAGEPYVLEYQKNIHRQLKTIKGFSNVRYESIVPKHVGMWILKRSALKLDV